MLCEPNWVSVMPPRGVRGPLHPSERYERRSLARLYERRRPGNLQVGGTVRPECRGRPTVRNLATGGVCRAMASTKVGDGLSYQAALRWVMGRRFCNAWAARVVQEKSPSRAGVVRAMARSDHWRCVSTPRWVRTSWKPPVASAVQTTGSGSGGRYRAGPEWRRSPGGLGSAPSECRRSGTRRWEVSSRARVMPSTRPPRRSSYIRLLKENFRLQWRATVLARLTGWRWRIESGVQIWRSG